MRKRRNQIQMPEHNLKEKSCQKGRKTRSVWQDKIFIKKSKFAIDKTKSFCYNSMAIKNICYRDVAQLVARMVWDHDAAGSNPVISTTYD